MEKIYIFGHKKPDTDSTVSAICLSYLKNKMGYNSKPYVLGTLNSETRFVLDYFKVKEPDYLHDINIQVSDINYPKNIYINTKASIFDAYSYIIHNCISTVPIVDNNKKFLGALSTKDITKNIFFNTDDVISSTIKNISNSIDGITVSKNVDVKGLLTINKTLDKNHILVMDKDVEPNKYTKLIISSNYDIKTKLPLIKTNKDIIDIIKSIYLSNFAIKIMNKNIITINENTELTDFLDIAKKAKRTNYPVLDNSGKCLGIISTSDINDVNKKKVILVDHNEFEQSANGINDSDIIEIIDHHKIGLLGTREPINFKNVPVGSTSTIIYNMFKENKIKLPRNIAGLLLAGIISDTLLLKSPTTTDVDVKVLKSLVKETKINLDNFSKEMFKARSIVKSNLEDMIFDDYKTFNIDNKKIGISQITTTDVDSILCKKDELLNIINKYEKENNLALLTLFITDLLNNGSYILFGENDKKILENAFDIDDLKQGNFFKKIMSRKKQIVPLIIKAYEQK